MLCPLHAPDRAKPFAIRPAALAPWLVVASVMILATSSATAQTLDLKLNVLYNQPANAGSGGTWELVAKSSGAGIAGVEALLTGIAPSTITNRAPSGLVNGHDPAGFFVFNSASDPLGFTRILLGQAPLASDRMAGEEEAIFYGVGTIANGEPGLAGPEFTSLTNVANSPWATGDLFQDPGWETGAVLASGTFLPGMRPDWFSSDSSTASGSIFTGVGTSTNVGPIEFDPMISTFFRDNLDPIEGDYNRNGIVDAADYTVWRDSLGLDVSEGSGADGNGDGIINEGDYDIWKSNFGSVGAAPAGGLGLGASVAVPEASSLLLLATAIVSLAGCRGRRTARRARA